jgi:hypothetical protein
VLSEEIKHHVKEEEQKGGIFSEARKPTSTSRRWANSLPPAKRN